MNTPDDLILAALRQSTQRTARQLSEMTGLGAATLYPAIVRLEQAKQIVGEWDDMPYPRRRRYRLLVG